MKHVVLPRQWWVNTTSTPENDSPDDLLLLHSLPFGKATTAKLIVIPN